MTPLIVLLLQCLWHETGRMIRNGEGDYKQLVALRIMLMQYIDVIEPD